MSVFVMFCALGSTPLQSLLILPQRLCPVRHVLFVSLVRLVWSEGRVHRKTQCICLTLRERFVHLTSRYKLSKCGGESVFHGEEVDGSTVRHGEIQSYTEFLRPCVWPGALASMIRGVCSENAICITTDLSLWRSRYRVSLINEKQVI